jgi:hypothetical protein
VVGPRVLAFIEQHTLAGTLSARRTAVDAFEHFLRPFGNSFVNATLAQVTTFLLDLVESGRLKAAQSVQSYLSAIDTQRAFCGVRPFQQDHDRLWQLFKAAVGKALPMKAPIDVGNLPTCSDLVRYLPSDRLLRGRVQRVALLVRMTALLRSKDVMRIQRSTIERVRLPTNREVVRFRYLSKTSTRLNLENDVNYVEFLDDAHAAFCPARALLALRVEVERLLGRMDEDDQHDGLLISYKRPFGVLSADTIGRYSKELLERWIDDTGAAVRLTGHKLRLIAAETLKNRGVPHASLCIRGGWKPDGGSPWSSVLQQIYQSRCVPENFASVSLVPLPAAAAAGTVSELRLE